MDQQYETIRVRSDGGVLHLTVDHPPINLLDGPLIADLAAVVEHAAADPAVRVLVFDSADPDFFIAHADVQAILAMPVERHPRRDRLHRFHELVERVRTLPKVTIAAVAGRARGGGAELVWSMDLRFAAAGRAVFGQPEVAIGIIPGGSGTQRLPSLVGRGRALEMILGCDDVVAEQAERWGLVNRVLPDAELIPFVLDLASRIASFPPEAVAAAKEAVDVALGDPVPGLRAEADLFNRAWSTGSGRPRIERFLALGGQTREIERDLPAVLARLD
ncbi:MAG: hypothetical protein JWO37_529 [Acidimicrobiales bacterium]|jgi:enoyl-CoA hydratase/carnithine racemase|nr:hypothetical protein [Acidimicrobiales bacterium]